MIDSLGSSNNPDIFIDRGQRMSSEHYLSIPEAALSMQEYIASTDQNVFASRGLQKFKEMDNKALEGTICLPTTTLMALRHMGQSEVLNLADFYELGVLTHVNDRADRLGNNQKGYPSFHRRSLDTYLRYALEFSKVAGLSGGIITQFDDLNFVYPVIAEGGLVIVSFDNLFIPDVMNKSLDRSTFKISRHAELVHGKLGGDLLISDTKNKKKEITWNPRNVVVPRAEMEKYLTCPRLNDGLTRAIVLTTDAVTWANLLERLRSFGKVEDNGFNPILKPHFGKGVKGALGLVREIAEKGNAEWDMFEPKTDK
ncbi:MAG: hypothetical protein U0525_04440 [Patescibacteria group bacterium]